MCQIGYLLNQNRERHETLEQAVEGLKYLDERRYRRIFFLQVECWKSIA